MKKFFIFHEISITEHLRILQEKSVNFSLESVESDKNWHCYDVQIYIGQDSSQHPVWNQAYQILMTYQFTPPEVMCVYFDETLAPDKRDLSLNTRFLFLRFQWGGRISQVLEDTRQTEKGLVEIRGISYQTLETHFEQGQLSSEIWKYKETGEVYFRMHAYSRIAKIKNPFYRVFFPIGLRFVRPYFIWRALWRMKNLANSF